RVAGQQSGNHRIHGPTARLDAGLGRGDDRRGRDACGSSLRTIFALAFIIEVEESLVLHDGPAQRASKLIVIERALGIGIEVEVVAGAELPGSKVIQQRTVELIWAGLGHNVYDRSASAAVFSLIIRNNFEFSHGVERQNGSRIAEYSGLVDGGIVTEAIIHIGAVEQEV